MKPDRNSFRNFPPDLLLTSSIPLYLFILMITLITQALFSLRGWLWVAAYSLTLLLAASGAIFLFRAKLPLFRQRRFFTFGSRPLPASSVPLYRRGWQLALTGILLAVLLLLLRH